LLCTPYNAVCVCGGTTKWEKSTVVPQ
jgi:hypothetical protein